jgi:hypothetical protein
VAPAPAKVSAPCSSSSSQKFRLLVAPAPSKCFGSFWLRQHSNVSVPFGSDSIQMFWLFVGSGSSYKFRLLVLASAISFGSLWLRPRPKVTAPCSSGSSHKFRLLWLRLQP